MKTDLVQSRWNIGEGWVWYGQFERSLQCRTACVNISDMIVSYIGVVQLQKWNFLTFEWKSRTLKRLFWKPWVAKMGYIFWPGEFAAMFCSWIFWTLMNHKAYWKKREKRIRALQTVTSFPYMRGVRFGVVADVHKLSCGTWRTWGCIIWYGRSKCDVKELARKGL